MIDPFSNCFRIKHNEINAVLCFLSTERLANRLHSFNELELRYGGSKSRPYLIHILRYAYLINMYDEEFWEKISSDAPTEFRCVTGDSQNWCI